MRTRSQKGDLVSRREEKQRKTEGISELWYIKPPHCGGDMKRCNTYLITEGILKVIEAMKEMQEKEAFKKIAQQTRSARQIPPRAPGNF